MKGRKKRQKTLKYKMSKKMRKLSPEVANMMDGFNLIDPPRKKRSRHDKS